MQKGELLLTKCNEMKLESLAGFKLPWIETLSITADKPIVLSKSDIHNDLARELAFYQQALFAANEAKKRIHQAKISFSRPDDFFAEMVKSDEHMEKIKERLVEEAQSIKKSEEAKKMRDMKKFGKQIQAQKIQERAKMKSETLRKIGELKRKRKNNPGDGLQDDEFDISLIEDDSKSKKNKVNHKRQKKDEKFGFGGKKRHAKSNTNESTDNFDFDSKKNKLLFKGAKGAKKQSKRLGKSRRQKVKGH